MRKLTTVGASSVAALALLAAPASAEPRPVDIYDYVSEEECGFPVLIHEEGPSNFITFLDEDGNLVRYVLTLLGGYTVTFTNALTGESYEARLTGTILETPVTMANDVTSSFNGAFLHFTHPVTGELGIFVANGRFTYGYDSEIGDITRTFVGDVGQNICAILSE